MSENNWKDLKRNAFSFNLHPRMLMPNGYTTYTTRHLKGELDSSKVAKSIHFDVEYVCAWLIKKVIEKLSITSYQELETLVKLSWDAYIKQSSISKAD